MSKTDDSSSLKWTPPDSSPKPISKYREHINQKYNKSFKNSQQLQKWTIDNNAEFWVDLYRYLQLVPPLPEHIKKAYDETATMSSLPVFFENHKLNYAENALFANPNENDVALIGLRECEDLNKTTPEKVTWKELREKVRKVSSALRRSGVKPGDRIAALVSNSVWAMVLFLSAASQGIIFTSINPDLGAEGCISRLRQVTPKILFADSDGTYKGKRTSIVPKVEGILAQLEEKPQVFMIPVQEPVSKFAHIDEFMKKASDSDTLEFNRVPFHHPLFICYSSGTTKEPKCIVHQHGLILNLKKISILHCSLGPGDVILQFTTTTWVMFQIMAGHLTCGCTCVCYDGSPMYPDVKQMLRICEKFGVTYFGTSPRYLLELEIAKSVPKEEFDIKPLHMVNTTGAPLSLDQYTWFYKTFPNYTHLNNTAGGTDTSTSLLAGDPDGTIHFGEMPMAALGAAIDVLNADTGESVKESGESGEMVITKPFPSMPPFFWADPEGKQYHSSYFETFDNVDVWAQSDWLSYNAKTGGYVMHGRSDGVLNPSGIRFGSGEIYAIVEAPPFNEEIAETLCVGRRRQGDKDEQVFLFIKMLPGKSLTPDLQKRLTDTIAQGLSRRHVPKFMLQVDEIPATINGKKIETSVKSIISGKEVKISSTVANPEVLKSFTKYRDIESQPKEAKL